MSAASARHLTLVSHGNAAACEPCPIVELATVMAEEMWVDMRLIPTGVVERVQVKAILIRRDTERVQIAQIVDGPKGKPTINEQWVEAADIWWVRQSEFEPLDEIHPFKSDITDGLESGRSASDALDAAFEAVAWYRRIPRNEMEAAARAGLETHHHRYWVMLVYYELTDRSKVSKGDVTAVFGYNSIQPLLSAQHHVTQHNGKAELDAMVAAARLRMP